MINSDFSDNGANFHINAGQRYLDRLMDNDKSIGRRFVDVVAGDYIVTFEECRSILEVWFQGVDSSGDVKRMPLNRVEQGIEGLLGIDRRTAREHYTAMHGDLDNGWPLYWTPAQLRLQTDRDGTTGGLGGFADVLADGFQTYNGIVFRPPTDVSGSVEIIGNFYVMQLNEDVDSSFWSDVHPDVLLMATLRSFEISQRNRAGVEDWTAAIASVVEGIDMDAAREESADTTEMNG